MPRYLCKGGWVPHSASPYSVRLDKVLPFPLAFNVNVKNMTEVPDIGSTDINLSIPRFAAHRTQQLETCSAYTQSVVRFQIGMRAAIIFLLVIVCTLAGCRPSRMMEPNPDISAPTSSLSSDISHSPRIGSRATTFRPGQWHGSDWKGAATYMLAVYDICSIVVVLLKVASYYVSQLSARLGNVWG